jgi:hypothetical protein
MFGWHPALGTPAPVQEQLPPADPKVPSRSCCCPARPVVKIVMPPVPGRPHPVDLWLCGHHYRASRAALLLLNADVADVTQPVETAQDAFADIR